MVQRSIFPIFSHILLFLTLFTVERVSPSQVVLFDSSNTHTELNWDTWYNGKYFPTGDTSNMERSMWYEETWSGFDDQSNVRVYGICPTNESPSNESTYLFLPVVQVKQAKGVFVHLTYTVLPCGPDKISCRETVHIHAKEFSGARDHENYDIRYFDPSRPDFLNEWKRVKVLTVSNGPDTVSFPLQLRQDTSHIRLAIDDNRACASILIAKVYYTVCDEYTKDFAKYESTISSGDPIDNIMVKGKCVNNAVETNNAAPVAFCGSTGSWTKHVIGSCECLPGFRNSSDKSCQACPVNTYKSDRGSQECRKCPSNSEAYRHGSAHCTCRTGYYRAPGESVELGCTQPPASPTGIEVKQFNQTDVELKWNEPSTLGGRPEIWYEWQCARGDCSGVKAYPADKRLSSRVIRLSGLKSNSDYVFNIFAKNKVSEVAGASTVSYRAVDVRTISIDMYAITGLRVESEMRGGVQLAWDSPNVNNNIGPFEIEISIPHLGGIETRTSHSPSFTMSNINDGITYYFRVRAHVDRWGEWSKPLRYEAGHALIHTGLTHPVESQDFFITPWMLGLIVLLLLVLLSCVFLLCRIKTKNRKQMSDLDVLDTYKQDTMTPDYSSAHRQFSDVFRGPKLNAPLITYGAQSIPPPYYGSSPASKFKPYVDPSAYEDPNQALIEFASDIDPSSVFITQVIGGGEFGDVCMGGLKKIHGEVETVAIKTLKPGSTCKAKADFLLEASIMGQFAHPNVVRLIGVVTKSEPSMIVTEYMENGSLDHYLRSRDANGEDFGWTRIVDMLRGIAAGMKYLTDKGYVHRDLAARNVLVDSKLNCKIADFGLSRGVDDTAEAEYTTNGGKIPIRWTSPEAITHRKFTAASDVWSFGVLTWEVCSYGERPYWDWTNHKVISEIMAGYRLPAPMDCPASLHRLMLWCWKLERHERPSFAQLLSILEKYTRSPERIFLDSTLPRLNKDSVNTVTLRSNMCPPSPSGSPPVYPPLEDFLQSIGVGHTITKLNSSGVYTVVELSRMNHIDLLSRGLITEEYQRISQALSKLLKKSVTSLTTTPVHSRTLPRPQEGFFV